MLDFNGFTLGACLFFASVGILWRKERSILAEALTLKPSYKKSSLRKPTALIDLQLPSKALCALQHLKNDEILAKCITDVHGQYFVCVRTESDVSSTVVYDYISMLYSKMWNEAVLKNCLDLECYIISDLKSDGMISRAKVLSLPELSTIYTSRTEDQLEINRNRRLLGLKEVVVTETENITNALDLNFNRYQNIIFFDACCNIREPQAQNAPQFKRVALGGTFDHIHNGHRKLLTLAAASCTELLTVGVMSESMLSKKASASLIGKYSERAGSVQKFLETMKPSLPVNIVELTDPFGPTITEPNIDAIIVSSETISGAFKINSLRKEKGMSELAILVTYRMDSAVLSSTFIRERSHTSH